MRRARRIRGLAVTALLTGSMTLAACGGDSTSTGSTSTPPSGGTVAGSDATGTAWLCRPGLAHDPCADSLSTTSVPTTGPHTVSVAVFAAWDDYLAHENDGRPVIFIGHSQGAAMLIRLLSTQIDPSPALRGRMVSAILAGGNVTVPTGQAVGATFKRIPLCTSGSETGCVIAYSSFPEQPPARSEFGRPGQGVSLQSGQTATVGVQVACVNPAALGGGTAGLEARFLTATMPPPPPAVTTRWVTYPGLYTASCQNSDGATWLQVSGSADPGDSRPVVSETLGPRWGYHLDDINLTLRNLVSDVHAQEQAYSSHHG